MHPSTLFLAVALLLTLVDASRAMMRIKTITHQLIPSGNNRGPMSLPSPNGTPVLASGKQEAHRIESRPLVELSKLRKNNQLITKNLISNIHSMVLKGEVTKVVMAEYYVLLQLSDLNEIAESDLLHLLEAFALNNVYEQHAIEVFKVMRPTYKHEAQIDYIFARACESGSTGLVTILLPMYR